MASSSNGAHGASVLDQLDAIAPQLEAEIAELEGQRAEIGLQIARLRKLQAALTVGQAPERRQRGVKTAEKRYSPETMARAANAILAFAEPFTVGQLADTLGIGTTSLYGVVSMLRDRELIGKAAVLPSLTGTGKGPQSYRIMERQALAELADAQE